MNLTSPDIFCDVFDQLERDGVRYVVISGIAVVMHGHVRAIADLDIFIDPAPEESSRALTTLARIGFVPSIPLPLNMLSVLRMFDTSQREVDVFVRYCIPFQEVWADSKLVHIDGHVARIMSLEHLLRAKRFNGRPHDLLDIEALLALQANSSGQVNDLSVASEQDNLGSGVDKN